MITLYYAKHQSQGCQDLNYFGETAEQIEAQHQDYPECRDFYDPVKCREFKSIAALAEFVCIELAQ